RDAIQGDHVSQLVRLSDKLSFENWAARTDCAEAFRGRRHLVWRAICSPTTNRRTKWQQPIVLFFTLAPSMNTRPKPLVFALLALTSCGKLADSAFCGSDGCGWKDGDWTRVASLADDPEVVELGRMFFFDPAFSGTATQETAIRRDSPPARVAKGASLNIS